MPKLDEIKNSLAVKMSEWKRQAAALESQLNQCRESAIEKLAVKESHGGGN